jgi:hypothetical protein
MSWSVSFIGTPDKIAAALDAESAKQNGQSKIEFDSALPALKTLLGQNFNNEPTQGPPMLKLTASGSGWARTTPAMGDAPAQEAQIQRGCEMKLERLHGVLV